MTSLHENLTREESISLPPDRRFGITMAVVFALLAAFSGLWLQHAVKGMVLASIATAFGTLAWASPRTLRPLNHAWMKLGLWLHRVVNPVIMLALYIIAIVPMGMVLKALQKDPLRRKRDAHATTYWIARTPGPAPETMTHQF